MSRDDWTGSSLADDEGNLRPEVVRVRRRANHTPDKARAQSTSRPRRQSLPSAPAPTGCLLYVALGVLAAVVHACA